MAPQKVADKLTLTQQQEQQKEVDRAKSAEGGSFLENFANSHGNWVENILNDSLPANLIKSYSRMSAQERLNYNKVKESLMQKNIVDNPNKFPAAAVEASKKALEEKHKDTPFSVRKIWDDLSQAAAENPGRFAGGFAKALTQDPEMLLVPQGTGLRALAG